ncbi:hypothetical protein FJ567_16545 [Mesorhizobium sp. B2-4-16]|nr:hypothetical protein FJ567_16545 [Mesorhizobium sp. B2-4-16]TPL68512.1 hypothetical protein FJ956_17785 [Mesorhizobium sp. B2-4-3]
MSGTSRTPWRWPMAMPVSPAGRAQFCDAGPGLTNTATSLTVARHHRSPVLLLAGQTSLGDMHKSAATGSGRFHDRDGRRWGGDRERENGRSGS